MDKCPYCKEANGYYEKLVMSYTQYYNLDGYPTGASELEPVRGGKVKYCQDCNKNITQFLKEGE